MGGGGGGGGGGGDGWGCGGLRAAAERGEGEVVTKDSRIVSIATDSLEGGGRQVEREQARRGEVRQAAGCGACLEGPQSSSKSDVSGQHLSLCESAHGNKGERATREQVEPSESPMPRSYRIDRGQLTRSRSVQCESCSSSPQTRPTVSRASCHNGQNAASASAPAARPTRATLHELCCESELLETSPPSSRLISISPLAVSKPQPVGFLK